MTDHETICVYDDQVEKYATTIQQQPDDKILLDFIARLKSNDLVLDLGCGPAQSSAIMREKGLCIDAIDASQEMVKLANSTFDLGARQATFAEIDAINTYHGVWANFSLLHASVEEFPKILASLHQALKTKGVLHIAMKLGTGCKRDKLGRFYSYYSQIELCNLLASAQFSVQHIELGEALGLAGDIEPWIAITSLAG
ncbi:MAG: class I SAM-dependent methyltransferase [Oceanospirillaceae bacterium]